MKAMNTKVRIKSSVYPENWNPNIGFNEWSEYIYNEIKKTSGTFVSKGKISKFGKR